ncbi:SNF2 family N-terminal domain-containing protein [Lactarius hatsudake]|nr:SNF2 family N-terminal domain-containing protein [Lactarius hatsudake]
MRSSASSHQISYRTRERTHSGVSGCLTLNCKLILDLLRALLEDDYGAESTTATGQKRPCMLSRPDRVKRRNFGTEQPSTSCNPYESIPVLRHEFNLRYSKAGPEDGPDDVQLISDNDAECEGLTFLEESLIFYLRDRHANLAEPITLDCGDVLINGRGKHGGTVDAKLSRLEENGPDFRDVFFIPPLYAADMETEEGNLFSWVDALKQPNSHQSVVEVAACLRLVILPLTLWDESWRTLPFNLVVDVTLLFRFPSIFQPFTSSRKAQNRIELGTARRGLLHLAFPQSLPETLFSSFHGRVDVSFLYAVVQPARAVLCEAVDKFLQPTALIPALLPFQKRTVMWMLEREGKTFGLDGQIVSKDADSMELPVLWRRVSVQREDEQLNLYYHRLTETLTPDCPHPHIVRGGIVAEEPGLGKTVECIALIILNPGLGRNPSDARWNFEGIMPIKDIRTTLIVTPNSLSQQWIDELSRHAPSLKVLVYPGWRNLSIGTKTSQKVSKRAREGKAKDLGSTESENAGMSLLESWPAYINDFDVCVTTYDILRSDLNVARAPPVRPVRQTAEYSRDKRPISPLVVCEWYRVVMDEVQMVGGGKASEMVSLIPRLSSFAVSGTPAKTRVSDLSYVLKFLRVDPIIYAPKNWNRLIQPSYAAEFAEVFQQYTVRTVKSAVQAELTIPTQTRYVFPIYLGRVERHVYDQHWENALLQLGLDARGVTSSQNSEIDTTLLRSWLRKLRQICTHPQIGQLQRPGDKTYKPGVLKTMGQVLDGMKDQNWRNVMDDRRNKINEMVVATQIMQYDPRLNGREEKCLEILLKAENEADHVISEVLSYIADHDAQGEKLIEEAAALRAARREEQASGQNVGHNRRGDDEGGGRQEDHRVMFDDDDNLSDHEGLPKTAAGEEHVHKSRALQQRLRECYLTLHRVKFLQGDVYHWMGESKAGEEAAAYGAADGLRNKLLKFPEESAMRAMAQLRTDIGKRKLVEKDILVEVPYCPRGGILSTHLLEEADELIDRVLNEQSRVLWEWRTRIYELLTQKLTASNDGGEADGQEYSRTLETQGGAETYLQAYAMLLADRREVLSAERTILAVHDAKERKRRKTTAAVNAIAGDEPNADLFTEDIELQPEHEVLRGELMHTRKALLEKFMGRAVKSIVVDLSAVAAKITKDDDPEKILAREGVSSLRRFMSAQATLNNQIEADLALFRKAFNERILYFRHLQEISDSVRDAEWGDEVEQALRNNRAAQAELERKINTGRARQRFLAHLSEAQDAGEGEVEEGCILCGNEFIRGYITQCAHVFCEDCMKSWLSRHGKACPVCRFPIHVDALQRFSMQKKDMDRAAQPPEKLQDDLIPKSRRKIEYSTISPGLLAEIDTMEVRGSYGTKIDTLVRHLLYLQLADGGAKSIVFSAWEGSLHIVEHALTRNGIPTLRIDSGNRKQDAAAKFRNDPNILVLLLHGERQNAGLNVTCASRVFLLESVVHHSFEIQAIARIDRLGQSRPTEVYCYYAEDTVERNILDLAVRRGLSLYTTDRARGTVDTAAFAPEAENPIVDAPGKKQQKGDFIFRLDDMMSILFPHLSEDVEFLLPPEDVDMRDPSAAPSNCAGANAWSFAAASLSRSSRVPENAVAGPSRLGG